MSETKESSANVQQQMLAARLEWEINQMIFPHIKQQVDHSYPFNSSDEMAEKGVYDEMEMTINLDTLGTALAKMQPEEYSIAFRYIAFREISNVINTFTELANQKVRMIRRGTATVENPV